MFLISFLLGLTPFIYSTSFPNTFEFPKALVIRLITVLLVLYLVANKRLRAGFKWDVWDSLSLAWIAILTTSSLLAGNFSWSFWGGEYRYQGILTQASFLVIFAVARRLKIDFRPLILAAVLQSILVALQFWNIKVLGTDVLNYAGRPVGTFGQPGFVSEFLTVALGITFGKYILEAKRLDLILSLVFGVGSLLTLSLSGVLGIATVVLSGLFFVSRRKGKFGLVAVGVFLLTAVLFVGLNKEQITVNALGTPRVESRLSIWPASVKLFLQRPMLGYGAENLNKVFPDTKGGASIDRAHNALLDYLLSGGIFLGLLYLILVVSVIRGGLSDKRNLPYSLAFLGTLVVSQVSVPGVVNLLIFWVLAGRLLHLKYPKV